MRHVCTTWFTTYREANSDLWKTEMSEIFAVIGELTIRSKSERESICDFEGITYMCEVVIDLEDFS